MSAIVLLILVTVLYAGYNVFVKAATDSALDTATSTILATIALQATALMVSFCFAAMLLFKGDAQLSPGNTSLAWAATAGLCIGIGEIAYFYLFRGSASDPGMAASVAIPVVVSGALAISVVAGLVFFKESLNTGQILGLLLALAGVGTLAFSSVR